MAATGYQMIFVLLLGLCGSTIIGPKIRDFKAYVREGDLNIGYFSKIHYNEGCDGPFISQNVIDGEEVAFAVSTINNSTQLLPNITLGMVMLDSCYNSLRAIARSVYFLPNPDEPVPSTPVDYPPSTGWNLTMPGSGFDRPRHYSVVGTIGLTYSSHAVAVSALLSAFHIPLISLMATSDELNDKTRFPYFMRMVLPDRFAAQTIVDLAIHFNWTYVSLLYSEGPYGENGGKQLEKYIKVSESGICVAFSHRIPTDADEEEFLWIAKQLKKHQKARVVMMISQSPQQKGLLGALQTLGLSHTFVFLTGDVFSPGRDVNEGSIMVYSLPHPYPGYRDYLKTVTPWNNPANPWLPLLWQKHYDCLWNVTASHNQSCYHFPSMPDDLVQNRGRGNSFRYDSVFVYAHALHNLIQDHCPEHFQAVNKTQLRRCVKGSLLIDYMKQVSFQGYGGMIEFDTKGDILGDYDLFTYVHSNLHNKYTYTHIGNWDRLTGGLSINEKLLDWSRLMEHGGGGGDVPRSVCSSPCPARHYPLVQELPCCWDCLSCRDNEIIANNSTGCSQCPAYSWPDPASSTECWPIDPSYLHIQDPIAVGLGVLALVAILLIITITAIYIWYRKHPLIRATSRGLSYVILLGTLLSASDVIFFIMEPTQAVCMVRMLGFHFGVNLLYTPLMLKTTRIYRIFYAGKRSVRRPRFVSSSSQIIITLCIAFVLSLVVFVVDLLFPVSAGLQQQVSTQNYVELHCSQSLVGFLLPLAFNLVLILVCAVLGYLSRKLPENFNESWYIFISVATTLFMWLVLLPTYFTAFYTYQQAALLAFCLLLNAYITLGCLFLTKIYAIFYVEETRMKFSANSTEGSSRVFPMSASHTSDTVPSCSAVEPTVT